MGDITNPALLYAKGSLMLAVGLLASIMLLLRSPGLATAGLLGLAIWIKTSRQYEPRSTWPVRRLRES